MELNLKKEWCEKRLDEGEIGAGALGILPCGHPVALLVCSIESDYQYCELCETKDRLRDALTMERELSAKLKAVAAATATIPRRK